MRLGSDGHEWVSTIHDYAGEHPAAITEWQQNFVTDYFARVVEYEDQAFVSLKQIKELNKIAEQFGLDKMDADQFDED